MVEKISTEMIFILCTWFGEISSCSCFTALPGPARVLFSKICKPFVGSLYIAQIPWLPALQAVGLGRQNINRKFARAIRLIIVKHAIGGRPLECGLMTFLFAFAHMLQLGFA